MGLGENYRQALALAREELGRWSGAELERRLVAAGAEWLPSAGDGTPGSCPALARAGAPAGAIGLTFLGRPLLVTFPEGRVTFRAGGAEVPQWLAILTLHYLNGARGAALAGELVPFRDLPGGRVYDANFEKRVRARLVRRYARQPALLVEAGRRLGGEAVDMGDAGVRLLAFPRVPLWVVLWAADEEFPAQANVLFDASIGSYLCTEDVVVLCEQVVSEMINVTGKEGGA